MNGLTREESRKRSYATTLRGHVLQRSEASAAIEFQGPDFRALMRRELAAAWAAGGMFECVALGYLGVSSALILFFAENLAHPVRLIVTQALVATVILALCRVEAWGVGCKEFGGEEGSETDRSVCPTLAQRFWHFWRHWYPHLFFLFCFEELGRLVHLVQ